MAAIVWPATLPAGYLLPVRRGQEEAVVRTPTQGGVPKVRERFSVAVRPITVRVVFTDAQLALFDTFFNTTTKHGSLRFDRADPATGTVEEMRIISYPRFSSIGIDANGLLWEGSLQLEVLP